MEDENPIQAHNTEAIKKVIPLVKEFFKGASSSHDWDHTCRVVQLAKLLGRKAQLDIEVLIIAAYLHDIGRQYQDASEGDICHAEKGVQLAKPIVNQLDFIPERQTNILHCIQTHRYRKSNLPKTPEARALFDADKLDAIGAIGIARAYLFAGEVGARLHNPQNNIKDTKPYSFEDTGYREYKVKLCKIKDRMLTQTGRRIAEDRHQFMELFFNQFLDEYQGIR